ncbi:MAG TPA: hypothetical protein VI320_13355, partial [Terracidiphilus sp.]
SNANGAQARLTEYGQHEGLGFGLQMMAATGVLGHPPLTRQKSILGGKHGVRRRRVHRKFAPFPVGLETDDAGVDMASFLRRSLTHWANEF